MALCTIAIPIANGRQYVGVGSAIPLVGNSDVAGNLSKWTCKFDSTDEQKLHFYLPVPENFLSGYTVRLRWRANATTGSCVWKIYYANLASLSIPAAGSAATVTTAVPGVANQVTESVLSLTTAAGRSMPMTISRDAGNVSDTLAVDAELLEVLIEYTADATYTKKYVWIPANAFAIPAGSSATLTAINILNSNNNWSYALQMPVSSYADVIFSVPSSFSSTMKYGGWGQCGGYQTYTYHCNMARIANGGSSDPTLTVGGTFAIVISGGYTYISPSGMVDTPITPVAGDEIVLRLVRDAGGAGDGFVLGVLLEYLTTLQSPSSIRMQPRSAALPTSNPATLTSVNDTNSSKLVAQFADGSDQQIDLLAHIASIYSSGGTLRVKWRTSAASGNGYFRVDHASPATSSDSDPALTSGTPFASASGGANVVNEFTVDISSDLAASDMLYTRIVRLGSDPLDTLSATVELLDVVFEATVA